MSFHPRTVGQREPSDNFYVMKSLHSSGSLRSKNTLMYPCGREKPAKERNKTKQTRLAVAQSAALTCSSREHTVQMLFFFHIFDTFYIVAWRHQNYDKTHYVVKLCFAF